MNPESLAGLVDHWASRGQYEFRTADVEKALEISTEAAQAAIRRLRGKGIIASPQRGFHVYMPPEYRVLGCPPPAEFVPQLMEHLGQDYYVALLSAGQVHGAAHQRPQVYQVMVARSRPMLTCGRARVEFVVRRNVARVPTQRFQTPRGYYRASSREATAIDLVGYAGHSGGLSNVATVLIELVQGLRGEEGDGLDDGKLEEAAQLSPIPWAQRLGFLLEEYAGKKVDPLAEHVRTRAREYVPLRPGRSLRRAKRSPRWRLLVNDVVEPDL